MSPSQSQPTSNSASGQPTNLTSNNTNDELRAPRLTDPAFSQGGNGESQNKETVDINATTSSNVGGRMADPPNRRLKLTLSNQGAQSTSREQLSSGESSESSGSDGNMLIKKDKVRFNNFTKEQKADKQSLVDALVDAIEHGTEKQVRTLSSELNVKYGNGAPVLPRLSKPPPSSDQGPSEMGKNQRQKKNLKRKDKKSVSEPPSSAEIQPPTKKGKKRSKGKRKALEVQDFPSDSSSSSSSSDSSSGSKTESGKSSGSSLSTKKGSDDSSDSSLEEDSELSFENRRATFLYLEQLPAGSTSLSSQLVCSPTGHFGKPSSSFIGSLVFGPCWERGLCQQQLQREETLETSWGKREGGCPNSTQTSSQL
ncbi:uncharacterized protein MELLADRAFT_66935 [Melampsora larici-populina 98AG31]|uniref:Uncharacterized protein n=1 Tax=Melampsora larici-populina (strain 98AG31 / pathotype 3-4-7) TaxID=747676 RepID=F4S160_MELLP|nr:uncharacterized protein MELLADRAFT_66935 [Melampsora larici-populina 98AG31]EGG01623.1 hypothetical protein MELLADRAFT_66935 [Melampsora larici-populina 98AG31]